MEFVLFVINYNWPAPPGVPSVIGFSVCSLCVCSQWMMFFQPPLNQPLMDGFQSLKCVQMRLDEIIKSVMSKFAKV